MPNYTLVKRKKLILLFLIPDRHSVHRISGYLRDTIWRNKYLRTDAKVRIYKSIITQVLACTDETMPNTAKTRMLQIAEMRTLRTILQMKQ